MASVVSTKTRKLDAICAKLKLISNDLPLSLPGLPSSSTPCRPEPLTRASFDNSSPINFSLATKTGENEVVGIPGGELPENSPIPLQMESEKETDPLIVNDKEDDATSESCRDPEGQALSLAIRKYENDDINTRNSVSESSPNNVTSSECDKEEGLGCENNNNDTTDKQSHDLISCNSDESTSKGVELSKKNGEDGSKSFLENGEEDNVCRNEMSAGTSSIKPSTLSSVPTPTPSPISTPTVSALSTPTISSQQKVSGASRRKSRKATPRNISQVRKFIEQYDRIDDKDELAQYELNNQNTTFPPPENDEEYMDEEENARTINENMDTGENLSVVRSPSIETSITSTSSINDSCSSLNLTAKSSEVRNSRKNRKPQMAPSFSVPLDLSVGRTEMDDFMDSDSSEFEYSMDGDEVSLRSESGRNSPEDLRLSTSKDKPSVPKTTPKNSSKQDNLEISALKDYAENTMNELLQMYGLSRSADSITGQVHPENFSSNKILAHGGPGVIGKDKFRPILPKNFQLDPAVNGFVDTQLGQTQTTSLAGKAGIYVNYVNTHVSKAGKQSEEANKQQDKFTNSAAYIKAVFNHQSKVKTNSQGKILLPDYSKYLKRFNNGQECKVKYCHELGYREHFHCMDCNFRVFVKKEEMVRHFKWHRKREESLQHGFMRYSPMDDCSQKFVSCTHNGRQTHYHCLQGGCDKVYISTSDVQMHANYHRKDSAIIQEGFQRFRATEDCGTPSCAFYGQRTTHFHCRRPTCNFTFKNKADMEKHKTYHQKDEVLAKDGFKKFMKYEHCGYMSCRYSKVSNHIHCIRSGCNYVLHSTAQLYSHKRKHERRDFESAYRKFRDDQQDNKGGQIPGMIPGTVAPSRVNTLNNVSLMSNQQSMSLPVAIKREALDDFDSNDSKRFKTEQPSMSLPVSIKQEAFDDSESNESKLMQEDQPENLNENSFSDVKSESSESDTAMDVSHHDLDSDSGKDDATDVPETFYNEPKASTMAALNLTGVKLSDSLTLPIPTMHLMDEIKVTSPQEVTPVRQHLQLPVQIPTSVSSMATSLATPASSPAICQPVTTATSVALPARPPIMEKRERDESWKSYLIRYTANDPCNSRCQYLYKDHYHCKVEGCLVLFKSKDGVREHARFHELQDRITPVAYHVYEPLQACPNSCQYSLKEKHYHCIWSGCTHVVPHIGPTFGRLEHYRIHEYARASQGKTYKFSGSKLEDNSPRRRGRPPKYPKIDIPIIPKVELSEEEIAQSTRKIAINSAGLPKVINGFKMFEEREECPDELCIYRQQQHYHCARPRCHHATDRLDVLNLHAKDFHNFVNILEGFEFFDRNVNCRRNHCNNNKINRHFHCVKPKCDYSFVRHSTMMQHDKKHRTEGATELKPLQLIKKEAAPTVSVPGFMPIIPALSPSPLESVNKGIIKTSGTFFPWSGLSKVPGTMAIPTLTTQLATQLSTVNSLQAVPVAVPNMALVMPTVATVSAVATPIITQGLVGANVPLSMLLQQKGSNSVPQRSWQELKESMHFDINQNCGRPFCKLKKKDHFHCFDCNQAFSDPSRLRVHICKHGIKINKSEEKPPVATPISVITTTKVCATGSEDYPPEGTHLSDPDEEDEDELNGSSSLNLEFSTFSSMIAKAQQAHATNAPPKSNTDGDPGLGFSGKLVIDERFHEEKSGDVLDSNDNSLDELRQDDLIDGASGRKSGRKRTATKRNDFVDSNSILVKQKKSTSPRSGKDDSIPDGYTRIKQKEDCQHEKCAYRQGVTHFHCIREDCGYSFSDRSRLIQHTLRHERIDSLTGGEMRQYRMNQSCNLENCEYQGKASHFHCLKCDYCCTDSSKVLTHRKHHSKMDSISSQGFVKASIEDDCGVALCQYNMKQTHYHCTRTPCNYAVLGPAQMSSHKIKHAS
ncbi:zinc finger protein castor homolog 1-like [Mizuhopecten yessoensis]|uniref:zinc finger protein castor homolog 1-like n=1 Tax=Mizuhopecten yessoensis TaxID=6573 RepID=UPI000B45E861|nr:zinc finger protein castor homolog 1-like [Mizuhopecten yessoensis]XP_021355432.1 zinc finger protein castor homolog 1-like [Mizuhopecten yessoensis]